jgi:hypothetical protein
MVRLDGCNCGCCNRCDLVDGMNESYTGGPAFPQTELVKDHVVAGYPGQMWEHGMTLRDYFAAKAMQAAATNPAGADGFTFYERAVWAYSQADAMLKARES